MLYYILYSSSPLSSLSCSFYTYLYLPIILSQISDPACFIGWECRVVQFDKYVVFGSGLAFEGLMWVFWFDIRCYIILLSYTILFFCSILLFLSSPSFPSFLIPILPSSSHPSSSSSHSKYTCRVFLMFIYIPSQLSSIPDSSTF